MNEAGEVHDESGGYSKPLGTANNYNIGAKTAPPPANKTSGYGKPMEKSEVVTHPVVSLTPYQNKYVEKNSFSCNCFTEFCMISGGLLK